VSGRAIVGRLVLLALLLMGVAAAWQWRGVFDPAAWEAVIRHSRAAPLVFLALHIAGSLFFVPRTLLAVGAGLVFGMWWGIVWAAAGSVAGAIAGFLVARYIDTGLVERIEPARLAALRQQAERGGWRVVAMVRLVPIIPHSLANYAFGLTRVGLGAYAVGSLLGQLPLTVAFAEGGAAGGDALLNGSNLAYQILWPSVIGAAALSLSLLLPAMLRRRLRPVEPT
jgi:uncharacterized membrane protein YdjX (TVP38/TMEM64 family)